YLGYKTLALGGGNDTFMTLTKGVPHVIFSGPSANDIGITNGQYIATVTISGAMASATTNTQALNTGSGWVLSSGTTFNNYCAVTGYRSSIDSTHGNQNESRMWQWNFYSPDPLIITTIPDNYVSKVLNDNGMLKIWTQGRNNTTK